MDSITISNVDDDLKHRLQVRAARRGHSVEAEARDILRAVVGGSPSETAAVPGNLGEAIRAIVEPLGGIELEIPPRGPVREPPKFT